MNKVYWSKDILNHFICRLDFLNFLLKGLDVYFQKYKVLVYASVYSVINIFFYISIHVVNLLHKYITLSHSEC